MHNTHRPCFQCLHFVFPLKSGFILLFVYFLIYWRNDFLLLNISTYLPPKDLHWPKVKKNWPQHWINYWTEFNKSKSPLLQCMSSMVLGALACSSIGIYHRRKPDTQTCEHLEWRRTWELPSVERGSLQTMDRSPVDEKVKGWISKLNTMYNIAFKFNYHLAFV